MPKTSKPKYQTKATQPLDPQRFCDLLLNPELVIPENAGLKVELRVSWQQQLLYRQHKLQLIHFLLKEKTKRANSDAEQFRANAILHLQKLVLDLWNSYRNHSQNSNEHELIKNIITNHYINTEKTITKDCQQYFVHMGLCHAYLQKDHKFSIATFFDNEFLFLSKDPALNQNAALKKHLPAIKYTLTKAFKVATNYKDQDSMHDKVLKIWCLCGLGMFGAWCNHFLFQIIDLTSIALTSAALMSTASKLKAWFLSTKLEPTPRNTNEIRHYLSRLQNQNQLQIDATFFSRPSLTAPTSDDTPTETHETETTQTESIQTETIQIEKITLEQFIQLLTTPTEKKIGNLNPNSRFMAQRPGIYDRFQLLLLRLNVFIALAKPAEQQRYRSICHDYLKLHSKQLWLDHHPDQALPDDADTILNQHFGQIDHFFAQQSNDNIMNYYLHISLCIAYYNKRPKFNIEEYNDMFFYFVEQTPSLFKTTLEHTRAIKQTLKSRFQAHMQYRDNESIAKRIKRFDSAACLVGILGFALYTTSQTAIWFLLPLSALLLDLSYRKWQNSLSFPKCEKKPFALIRYHQELRDQTDFQTDNTFFETSTGPVEEPPFV